MQCFEKIALNRVLTPPAHRSRRELPESSRFLGNGLFFCRVNTRNIAEKEFQSQCRIFRFWNIKTIAAKFDF